MNERPFTILCLASEYKGIPFIEEAHRQGCKIILLTTEKFADHDWPWDSISQHFIMPSLSKQPDITYAVSYLTREHKIDRIVALDDYDVATAAHLREHLRLPGMGDTTARYFRDKLAMRVKANDNGIPVPPFTGLFHYDDLREFMDTVSPPWVLKPRFEAGAVGIQKMHHSEQVWRKLDELGDQQSFYLLEQFLPGDVFHVDSLIWQNEIVFTVVSRYGMPPLSVMQGGGIFTTRTLPPESDEAVEITAVNRKLVKAFGLLRGVTHTEFIQGHADGRFYFLETAARVGGANIDRLVKAATGVELWAEAARIEAATLRGEPYELPTVRQDCAGLITCLARQEHPDLSGFTDPEIVWRLPKAYHAGLLVTSPSYERVEALLDDYGRRFAEQFLTSAPPKTDVRTTI
jgi:hypothetical protein